MLVPHRQTPICLDNTDTDCRQKLWKKVHSSQTIEEDQVTEVWEMDPQMIQLYATCRLCEEINTSYKVSCCFEVGM